MSDTDGVSGFSDSGASYEELSTDSLINEGVLPPRQFPPPVLLDDEEGRVLGPLQLDIDRAREVYSVLPALRHGPVNLVSFILDFLSYF